MIHHKSFDLDLKAAGDAGGFTAYMARFGNLDRANEIIEPGAFKNLPAFAVDGWVGVNHDMARLPVAIVETAAQDATGLLVTARWHTTPEAQACRAVVTERLQAGKSVKCSIGYKVLDSFKDSLNGRPVTRLTGLDLFEASIVNLPANPAAEVIAAKSDGSKLLTLDTLKAWLDAETKAGRVLSRSNHSRLKEWHASLDAMCRQIKEMVDAHDPDREEPDEEGGSGEIEIEIGSEVMTPPPQKEAKELLDTLRAASLRARLAMAHPQR